MTERLTRVAARGFQGLDFDEALPPRLLITGPNGSGKTARLRAISLALQGPPSKTDGLQPWATSDLPSVVVEASTGLRVQRASKITRRDGGLSIANRSACEPSQGETAADAVAARIERELAPNLISLRLDALFGLSGPERRRALLEALGADAALAPAEILKRLDAEFGQTPDPTWMRIRAAANPRAFPDGLSYLAALEGAAKAQAGEYAMQKKAHDAFSASTATPGGDPDAIRRDLDAATAALRTLTDARAAGERGAADRARRLRERDAALAALPAAVRGLPPVERHDALVKTAAETSDALDPARAALDAALKALEPLEDASAAALAARGRAEGRLRGLRAVLEAGEASDGPIECPLCGKDGYDSAHGDAMIARAEKALEKARTKAKAADDKAMKAVAARNDAEKRAADAAKAAKAATDALATERRLAEAEQALRAGEGAAAAVADPSAIAAAEARCTELREALERAMKAEGERKARLDAGRNAEAAEEKRKRAVEIQARVGPKGMQGELLEKPVLALSAAMTTRWSDAGKIGALHVNLTDARGGPDASIVWVRDIEAAATPGGGVPLGSLSGGEKAVALACMVAALAEAKPERMSVALVEAGEIDGDSLVALCRALADAPLANIVVATHLPCTDHAGGPDFEVRRLGGAA